MASTKTDRMTISSAIPTMAAETVQAMTPTTAPHKAPATEPRPPTSRLRSGSAHCSHAPKPTHATMGPAHHIKSRKVI